MTRQKRPIAKPLQWGTDFEDTNVDYADRLNRLRNHSVPSQPSNQWTKQWDPETESSSDRREVAEIITAQRMMLRQLESGNVFGAYEIVNGQSFRSNLVAISAVEAIVIPTKHLLHLLAVGEAPPGPPEGNNKAPEIRKGVMESLFDMADKELSYSELKNLHKTLASQQTIGVQINRARTKSLVSDLHRKYLDTMGSACASHSEFFTCPSKITPLYKQRKKDKQMREKERDSKRMEALKKMEQAILYEAPVSVIAEEPSFASSQPDREDRVHTASSQKNVHSVVIFSGNIYIKIEFPRSKGHRKPSPSLLTAASILGTGAEFGKVPSGGFHQHEPFRAIGSSLSQEQKLKYCEQGIKESLNSSRTKPVTSRRPITRHEGLIRRLDKRMNTFRPYLEHEVYVVSMRRRTISTKTALEYGKHGRTCSHSDNEAVNKNVIERVPPSPSLLGLEQENRYVSTKDSSHFSPSGSKRSTSPSKTVTEMKDLRSSMLAKLQIERSSKFRQLEQNAFKPPKTKGTLGLKAFIELNHSAGPDESVDIPAFRLGPQGNPRWESAVVGASIEKAEDKYKEKLDSKKRQLKEFEIVENTGQLYSKGRATPEASHVRWSDDQAKSFDSNWSPLKMSAMTQLARKKSDGKW